MDLKRFDSITKAEAGVECKLIDPMTKADTGAYLVLFGADSSVYKQIEKEQLARHKNLGRALSAEEVFEDGIEKVARMTKDWGGFSLDGKDLPFSQETARKIYKAYPYIYESAATFMFTRTNFFEKASTS